MYKSVIEGRGLLKSSVLRSFENTLIGRRVSIVANGKAIVTDQIIPGITGGAIDSKEGEAVPNIMEAEQRVLEFREFEVIPAK